MGKFESGEIVVAVLKERFIKVFQSHDHQTRDDNLSAILHMWECGVKWIRHTEKSVTTK